MGRQGDGAARLSRRELLARAGRVGSAPPPQADRLQPRHFLFDEMLSDDVRRGSVLTLTLQGPRLVDWSLRQSYITGDVGQPQWV